MFLLALAIGFGWWLIQSRDATRAQTVTRKLMLTVFAGLLLGRIALRTSVLDYGFVLSVPGTLILIVALLDWLPAWFGAKDHRLVYTGAVLSVLALCVVAASPSFIRLSLSRRQRLRCVPQRPALPIGCPSAGRASATESVPGRHCASCRKGS